MRPSDTQIHIMQTCKHAHMRMQNENIMQRIIHAAIMQNASASYTQPSCQLKATSARKSWIRYHDPTLPKDDPTKWRHAAVEINMTRRTCWISHFAFDQPSPTKRSFAWQQLGGPEKAYRTAVQASLGIAKIDILGSIKPADGEDR